MSGKKIKGVSTGPGTLTTGKIIHGRRCLNACACVRRKYNERMIGQLHYIVRYAIVPMDICITVDDKLLITGQFFAPFLFVIIKMPVVAVEAPPEDGAPVPVEELLRNDA